MGNTVGRQFRISDFQKEFLVGCLLGDGRLESRSGGKSARLRIHHGEKQKDLIFWKYEIMRNLVSAAPKKILCGKTLHPFKVYYSWYFHTLTLQELGVMYRDFYQENKKILPENIANMLTPIGLAIWLMDDGCYDDRAIILNTQNFSLKEQETLKGVLQRKFGLHAGINKDRSNFRLRIVKEDFPILKRIVSHYVIPSMRYKIVPVTTSHIL